MHLTGKHADVISGSVGTTLGATCTLLHTSVSMLIKYLLSISAEGYFFKNSKNLH